MLMQCFSKKLYSVTPRVLHAGVENIVVGDIGVEDGVTGLPRWRRPHRDTWTSALKKRRARGAAVLRRLGGNGWRGLQMT